MKSAKKAKLPKKVKPAKLPKKIEREKLTKREKRIVKLTKKDLIKKGKILNKSVKNGVAILAVVLCVISSTLDVLLKEANKNNNNK